MTTIYAICSRTSGKIYIGKTIDLRKRLNSHKSGLCSYISKAIHKYGWSDFVMVTLANISDKAASGVEQKWIIKLGTMAPNGYNLTAGGEGTTGRICSTVVRKKIAEAKRGKPLSQDHRNKLSETLKGRVFSNEHRQKIQDARKVDGEWYFSQEHRQKISEALRGRKHSAETCRKMSEAKQGKRRGPLSQEHRNNISKAQKKRLGAA